MIELQVYENGTIYLNGYRILGRKIYASEGLTFESHMLDAEDIEDALSLFKVKEPSPNEPFKIMAIYVKNLKMSEGKIAAQVAHAVKNLGETPADCNIAVLGVSQTKFNLLIEEHEDDCYVQIDKGLTEVESGTATAAAWIVK